MLELVWILRERYVGSWGTTKAPICPKSLPIGHLIAAVALF